MRKQDRHPTRVGRRICQFGKECLPCRPQSPPQFTGRLQCRKKKKQERRNFSPEWSHLRATENPSPSTIFYGSKSVRCIPKIPRMFLKVEGGLTNLLSDQFWVREKNTLSWEKHWMKRLMGSDGCMVRSVTVRETEKKWGRQQWWSGAAGEVVSGVGFNSWSEDLSVDLMQWPLEGLGLAGDMMNVMFWSVNLYQVLSDSEILV